ncbi:hypothetical protein HK099_001387 [Clydaea vesicula]|uniref:YqaJ viral recombinase domain-containing protein n=1 Tax=Clydaea vesicula TaxID=447962 RepID=A0AAD5TU42_9FUNG|nr:hypothetical protein HK099_001387 [Clydaea vesicula]
MLITAIVDNLERAILRFKTKLRLKRIIKQPTAQFEQRSSNWISERKNIFTASEVACFIKKDKKSVLPYFDAFYSDRVNGNSQDFDKFLNDFLQTNKKLDNGIFTGIGVHKFDDPASVLNKKLNEQSKLKEKKLPQPLVWGTQFEKIALNLYQIKNELKDSEIFQTGLVVHEQYKFLGCSIDVLDLKNSYLVEFKCPFKEKKPFLPDLYAWIQTQIQMEIFDLSRAKIVISQFGEYSDVFTFTNDPETQQYSGIFIQESKSTDEVSCVYPPTEMGYTIFSE